MPDQRPAGRQHQQAPKDGEDESHSDRDMDWAPQGRGRQHGGLFKQTARWQRMQREPDGHQHTRHGQRIAPCPSGPRFPEVNDHRLYNGASPESCGSIRQAQAQPLAAP